MIVIWIVVGLLALAILYLLYTYNSLIALKMRVSEAWSGIDVQLKRRTDLVPNLIETVKGYARHEREVFENVTKARTSLLQAKTAKEAARADNMLVSALKTLFAVAEDYPDLKASENFKELQDELSDIEAKIAFARQFYNTNVMDFNTKINIFPNSLIARFFNFKGIEFFEAEKEERRPPKVNFLK